MDKDDLEKFFSVIDEGDIEQLRGLRDLAQQNYNFAGFDHVNLYNRLNYLNGTLHALEATRKKMSIESAERLIEILYTLGYASKRIIFILFEFGYLNYHARDVMNYIYANKRKLEKLREKFMAELDQAADDIFQTMKQEVMKAERDTLVILLENIDKLNTQLKEIDVVLEGPKFDRINKRLTTLLKLAKDMHGIDGIREAKIEIAKQAAISARNRAIAQGMLDDQIKQDLGQLTSGSGTTTEGSFVMIE